MPLPNVPEKYSSASVLTPERMLAYRQQAGMLPSSPGPERVILCLQRGLPERMARQHPLRKVGRLNGDVFLLKKSEEPIMVLTNFGLGSPLIAGLAEELVAWGASKLVSISMCGSLQPDLKAGAVVVCSQAVRDEGTSHHYLPSAKYVSANEELVSTLVASLHSAGLTPQTGATWTTDATFRETELEVQQYQSEGVKTVEMESAALFAVAQVRAVQAASVFVVGDTLSAGPWRPPQDMKKLDKVFEVVYSAVIDSLSSP